MTDQDSEQTDIEQPEGAIIPSIRRALNVETRELKSAEYVLNEELIGAFENPNMVFILEREPVRTFNNGYHSDTLVYDDKDFETGDITVTGANGENINIKEAYSLYERYDLKEPMTGKIVRINQMTYNHAYFPFNTMRAGTLEAQKQGELQIIPDFLDSNRKSAFDEIVVDKAKKEDISISFDGYIFSFSRIVHKNGTQHVELEIEQYNREHAEEKKCLRRSNVLEGFGITEFERLKTVIQDTVKRAKPKV